MFINALQSFVAAAPPRDRAAHPRDFVDTVPEYPQPLRAVLAEDSTDLADADAMSLALGSTAGALLRKLDRVLPRERAESLLAELIEQELSATAHTLLLPLFLHRVATELPPAAAAAVRAGVSPRPAR